MGRKGRDIELGTRGRDPNRPNPPPKAGDLRVASYNVRVDHTDDINTMHDWGPMRRGLVATSILGLDADLVALQEPSPSQAKDLEYDLGPEWGVDVLACDPDAWDANGKDGPSEGDAREGNGIAYRKTRFKLLQGSCFWLSPTPDDPSYTPTGWGGSGFQRTCYKAILRDLWSGKNIVVFSAHFDNDADDSVESVCSPRHHLASTPTSRLAKPRALLPPPLPPPFPAYAHTRTSLCLCVRAARVSSQGGSEARRQSATLVMQRAREAIKTRAVDTVIVAGDFNTFNDRDGDCYAALVDAANGALVDIRNVTNCVEVNYGRDDSSWEGWETDPYSRQAYGNQRYSQIFVDNKVKAARTGVVEERYKVSWDGEQWVYASDHLPIVADLILDPKRKGGRHGIAPVGVNSPAAIGVLLAFALIALGAFVVMGWMTYQMVGGDNIECRFECRDIRHPWDTDALPVNCTEMMQSSERL